jgi:hypothetical protein
MTELKSKLNCINCGQFMEGNSYNVDIYGEDFIVCKYCGYLSTPSEASGISCIFAFQPNPPIDTIKNKKMETILYVPTNGYPKNKMDYMKLYKIDPEIALVSVFWKK